MVQSWGVMPGDHEGSLLEAGGSGGLMTTFVIAMTLLMGGMVAMLVGTDWLDRSEAELDDQALPVPVERPERVAP
jgi:hypothetical protein